jgi:SsrA-binding protein
MAVSKDKQKHSPRIVNRKARHDYAIEESLEVGIALKGSEVKSIRNGQVSLAEGFARVEPATMELMLFNVNIAEYTHGGPTNNHEPTRPRKLLAHRRQIRNLHQTTTAKGTTLVPLAMYFVRGKVKLELGIARGRAQHDKRDKIDAKESDREIRRALSRRR